MLVLTRQRDQSVIIGDDITISLVDIRGDKVRLGITAPRHITVHRKEIYDEIKAQNQDSANLTPQDVAAFLSPPQTPSLLRLAQRPDLFLQTAIEEAQLNQNDGNLPIASLLIRNNQILAKGRDRRMQTDDPTAYAEIDCLKNAGRQSTYQDTILYSTLAPTHLGFAAAVQFGIRKIVIADSVNIASPSPPVGIEITDMHDAQCIDMLATFLREHPNPWIGDKA